MTIPQRFVRFVPSGRRDVLRRYETSGRPSLREVRRSGPARTLARKSGLPELFLANVRIRLKSSKSVRRGSHTLGRFDSGAAPRARNQRAVKRRVVPSVVPVAFVGNMVTLRLINLDEPAKPARQA
jgi:hypothetical protein